MENPKPESIQPLSIQHTFIGCPLFTCKSLLYKGKEVLLAVAYIKTTPVAGIREVPQEVNWGERWRLVWVQFFTCWLRRRSRSFPGRDVWDECIGIGPRGSGQGRKEPSQVWLAWKWDQCFPNAAPWWNKHQCFLRTEENKDNVVSPSLKLSLFHLNSFLLSWDYVPFYFGH